MNKRNDRNALLLDAWHGREKAKWLTLVNFPIRAAEAQMKKNLIVVLLIITLQPVCVCVQTKIPRKDRAFALFQYCFTHSWTHLCKVSCHLAGQWRPWLQQQQRSATIAPRFWPGKWPKQFAALTERIIPQLTDECRKIKPRTSLYPSISILHLLILLPISPRPGDLGPNWIDF